MAIETKTFLITQAVTMGLAIGFLGGFFTSETYHLRENRARNRKEILEIQRDKQYKAYEESSIPVTATIQSHFYDGQKLVLGCESEEGHLFGLNILDIPPGEMHTLAGRLSVGGKTNKVEFPRGNLSSREIQEPFQEYPLNVGEPWYSTEENGVSRYAGNVSLIE